MPAHRRYRQHGFSLLELSIALAVIGIVVAGGLSMSTNMVDRTAYVQTGNQMDEIDKAIAAFVAVNHRLPCPANPALTLSDGGYGTEQAACAGTQSSTNPDGAVIRIGALPVRSLGLRDRMGADEYGNRYTYAVTAALTSDATVGGYQDSAVNGGITMAGTGIDDAAYAVVSHGGDSKGAYRYETANTSVACTGGQDAENCNNDYIFRDTRFNRGSVAGNWFDDTVRFKRKEMINLIAGGATSTGTQYWEANNDHIYNTNSENVGVGIASPVAKLDVLAPVNLTALHVETANGAGTGLSVETNGGMGARIETWNAQHALQINSRMNENGLTILTNGNNSRSLWIDHAGTGGTGANIIMNNDGTALDIDLLGTGMGINIESTSGADGIYVDVWGSDSNQYAITGITNGGTGSEEDASAGVRGLARNSPGWGVYGGHLALAGEGAGVYGATASSAGYGVFGLATSNGGTATGVYGESNASGGRGLSGYAMSATGTNAGVYGYTNSNAGRGVQGFAALASGTTYGVHGGAASPSGFGVYGINTSATGNAYAGYFTTGSQSGAALFAVATSTVNNISGTKGIQGETNSPGTWAAGVQGNSNATTGDGKGVFGYSSGDQGIGVHGKSEGTSSTGVWGWTTATTGMNYGVRGQTGSTSGRGVQGLASAANGSTYGVSGQSNSPAGFGVHGLNTAGSGNAYGVYGQTSSTAGYGVWCQSSYRCGGNQTWFNTSDFRLKDHITTLDDTYGLDAIRKLRPVTYTWKDVKQQHNGIQLGFIAQEVEKILPEVVSKSGDQIIDLGNGKKETVTSARTMGYAELTVPLVRAVQQLADKLDALFASVKELIAKVSGHDADIAALKADNAKLKADNDALKVRLDALEEKLAK